MAREANASYEGQGQRTPVDLSVVRKVLNEIHIGTVILSSEMVLSDTNRHNVCGAYSDSLIRYVFNGITIPEGYRKMYRISATVSSNDAGTVEIGFNGRKLIDAGTWSRDYFRNAEMSERFYGWTDFPTENVDGYSKTGLNLYVKLNPPSLTGYVSGIMLHGYLEKI